MTLEAASVRHGAGARLVSLRDYQPQTEPRTLLEGDGRRAPMVASSRPSRSPLSVAPDTR